MSLVRGQVFTEQGELLASFSQDGMIRAFAAGCLRAGQAGCRTPLTGAPASGDPVTFTVAR